MPLLATMLIGANLKQSLGFSNVKYFQRSDQIIPRAVSSTSRIGMKKNLSRKNPFPLFVSVSDTEVSTALDPTMSTEVEFTLPDGVVCARGVCSLADEIVAEELCYLDEDDEGNLVGMTCVANPDVQERNIFSFDFLWPRALLLGCSMLYGTNFPLGRLMNEALPASAATSGRMILASAVLAPFLFKLKPELRTTSVIGGCFVAGAYLSQSLALVDTPAATVAFLGALTVVVTPTTSVLIDKAKLGWKDAPQTWLAAILCLAGVGALELGGGEGLGDVGWGDFWSAMQGAGFGIAFFFTEKMMAKNPDQALPITAVQVGVTAFFASVWALFDGFGVLGSFGGDNGAWLLDEACRAKYALPGLFLSGFTGDEALRNLAIAAAWTGLITTSANRVGETTALGKMSSSEAAVILATEPLWAALFASLYIGETLGPQDIVGGALIVVACLTTAVKAETLQNLLGIKPDEDARTDIPV